MYTIIHPFTNDLIQYMKHNDDVIYLKDRTIVKIKSGIYPFSITHDTIAIPISYVNRDLVTDNITIIDCVYPSKYVVFENMILTHNLYAEFHGFCYKADCFRQKKTNEDRKCTNEYNCLSMGEFLGNDFIYHSFTDGSKKMFHNMDKKLLIWLEHTKENCTDAVREQCKELSTMMEYTVLLMSGTVPNVRGIKFSPDGECEDNVILLYSPQSGIEYGVNNITHETIKRWMTILT